jgi:agmatinase
VYLVRKAKYLKDPLDVRICDISAPSSVIFIGVPWDGAVAGRPGARFAPGKIRAAFCNLPRNIDVEDVGDVDIVVGNPEETWRRIEMVFSSITDKEQILIAGGDHSITAYAYKGLTRRKKLSYVVLDAHLDVRQLSEGLSSGVTTRLIREFSGDTPISIVGVRRWANPRYMFEQAERLGIEYYTMEDVDKMGVDEVVEKIKTAHKHYDVYLSIDMDVVDPAYAPGVNAPSPGGFSSREVIMLVTQLSKSLRPLAVDVVEVTPAYDVGDVTSSLAAVLLYVSIWR